MSNRADIDAILKRCHELEIERAVQMPDDRAACLALGQVEQRLKELGWKDACYCPKDGSEFEVIEFGSTGIHRCVYHGEWPSGSYWLLDGGDLWPSRPILFRVLTERNKEPTK